MKLSSYQQRIYEWCQNPKGNLVIEAVAGSGKTTTIVGITQFLKGSITFVAFNKLIAESLQHRLPIHAVASTLNSFGYRIVRNNTRGFLKVKADKVANILQWDVFDFKNASPSVKQDFYRCRGFVSRIISLLKSSCFLGDTVDMELVYELADKHGIEVPVPRSRSLEGVIQDTWKFGLDRTHTVDFDDQIYLPIRNNYEIPQSVFVFVDEAQDLNAVQMELVARMGKHVIAVGDSRQAIYGFRGAEVDAMARLQKRLNADVLPLSICYRCPKAVIEAAKEIVPHIEPSPTAEEGEVVTTDVFDPKPGDFVACRVTAPLVSQCLNLIANGQKAMVLGREIGNGLVNFLEDLKIKDDQPIFVLREAVEYHRETASAKLVGRENQLIMVNDQCDTILAIASRCTCMGEVYSKINEIFSDTDLRNGVTFATIHRLKGLEADVVYILEPDLLPHPKATREWQRQQEMNLKYVAITRAQRKLVWVQKNQPKK